MSGVASVQLSSVKCYCCLLHIFKTQIGGLQRLQLEVETFMILTKLGNIYFVSIQEKKKPTAPMNIYQFSNLCNLCCLKLLH